MSKVLLYSGGTDSWLINKLWKPDKKIYINIYGRYSEEEIKRLPNDVEIIDFPFLGTIEKDNSIVPLRNLYFLMIASNYGNEICLGATKGDRGGKDKRPLFFKMTEWIINYCLNGNSYGSYGKIKICNEFYNKSKNELLEQYLNNGGTIEEFIEETFTCYNPINNEPCNNCKPCIRKFLLGEYYNYKYSEEQENKVIDYLIKNIIPKNNNNGTYFTKRKGEGKIDKIAVDKLFKRHNLNWKDYQ